MIRSGVLALLAGLVPLAAAAVRPAAAVEVRTYPGSACQGETKDTAVFRPRNGQLSILAPASGTVVCPIVRGNQAAGSLLSISVVVLRPVGSTVGCGVLSSSEDGKPVGAGVPNSATPLDATHLRLVFGVAGDRVRSAANGNYELACQLSPGAGVVSYKVTEK